MEFKIGGGLSRLDGLAFVHLHRLLAEAELLLDVGQVVLHVTLHLLETAYHLVLSLHLGSQRSHLVVGGTGGQGGQTQPPLQ